MTQLALEFGGHRVSLDFDEAVVKLPPSFVATKYPGYFWNTSDHKLYSLKSGTLRTIQKARPFRNYRSWKFYSADGYSVSVSGRRRFLRTEYLESLKPHPATIPVS